MMGLFFYIQVAALTRACEKLGTLEHSLTILFIPALLLLSS